MRVNRPCALVMQLYVKLCKNDSYHLLTVYYPMSKLVVTYTQIHHMIIIVKTHETSVICLERPVSHKCLYMGSYKYNNNLIHKYALYQRKQTIWKRQRQTKTSQEHIDDIHELTLTDDVPTHLLFHIFLFLLRNSFLDIHRANVECLQLIL